MFDFIPQEYEKLVNIIFLVITALIAKHGITYRKEDGERDFVRLVFGCIAITYFFLVLFKDVLGLYFLQISATSFTLLSISCFGILES